MLDTRHIGTTVTRHSKVQLRKVSFYSYEEVEKETCQQSLEHFYIIVTAAERKKMGPFITRLDPIHVGTR